VNKVNQARALRVWLSLGATAALGILLGCGEIGGAGQCFGVDVTGLCLTVDSIVPTDTAVSNEDTNAVDAFQFSDCDGDPLTLDFEPIGPHSAKVTISATLMPGVTSPPAPAFVTLEGYTVEFFPNPNNSGSSPALTGLIRTESVKINADSSLTATFELVPLDTKVEYVTNGGDTLPMNYSAIYTFTGKSQFFQDLVIQGATNFDIGSWDNCE